MEEKPQAPARGFSNRMKAHEMKKYFLFFTVLVLLACAFLAGYLTRSNGARTVAGVEAGSVPASVIQAGADDEPGPTPPGSVRVSPLKQQLMGVRLETVRRGNLSGALRVLGRVVVDETREYRINAAVDGWIREAYPVTTWSRVCNDEVLAIFYSPEFLGAQQAYLYALGALDRYQATSREPPRQRTVVLNNIQQYKDTLQNLGMSDTQIDEIARSRQYTERIEIRSPADGFVTLRNVSTGLRIEKGRELFRIADLGRVWILADLYENEAGLVRPGMRVKAVPANGGKMYVATVSRIPPAFDSSTRTLKMRLETDNPGHLLRPDMFVDLQIPVTLPRALSVAADAVLDTGIRKTVFVERGEGIFEPRQVKTGKRLAGRIEILEGLQEGERIVDAGNFLIDSESKADLARSQSPAD